MTSLHLPASDDAPTPLPPQALYRRISTLPTHDDGVPSWLREYRALLDALADVAASVARMPVVSGQQAGLDLALRKIVLPGLRGPEGRSELASEWGHGGVIALFALHRILQQAGDGWPAEADVWLRIRTSDKKEVTGRHCHRPLLLLHRHLHLTSPAPSRYR